MKYMVAVLLALLIPSMAQAEAQDMFVPGTNVMTTEDGVGRAIDKDERVLYYCEAEMPCDVGHTAGSDDLRVIDNQWPKSMFVPEVVVTLYEDGSGMAVGERTLLFCLQDWFCDGGGWPVKVYLPLIGQ